MDTRPHIPGFHWAENRLLVQDGEGDDGPNWTLVGDKWRIHERNPKFIELIGVKDAVVMVKAQPDGRYLWQFRKVVSYAATIKLAMDYVEAGAEYFEVMGRNPYK